MTWQSTVDHGEKRRRTQSHGEEGLAMPADAASVAGDVDGNGGKFSSVPPWL